MKLTSDHISKLLKRKEDERVEFKRATSELPDNLWETYSAFCNTAIFNIFALVDIGERSGMGLANLHGLWKKYGYAEPKITESYDPDRTVLVVTTDDDTVNDTVTRPESGAEPDQNPTRTRPEVDNKVDNNARGDINVDNKVDNNLGDDTVNGAASGPLSGPLSGLKSGPLSGLKSGLKSSLGATDSKVIDFIRSNPSVTIKELQELLNLSRNGVRKALGRLKSMGRLRRVGPDKGGHWEVVEK